MADLTIAAASVAWVSGPKDDGQTAGEAFIAGTPVFQSSLNNKWYKTKNSGAGADGGSATDAAGANGYGIALFTADAAGAKGSIARPGAKVQIGTGTAGTVYFLSTNFGKLCPAADLVSTNKSTPAAQGIGGTGTQVRILDGYDPGSVVP